MRPQAEETSFFVILVFTWLIAAGNFTHVIVGSVEIAVLIPNGSLDVSGVVFGFFLPVLAGNIVGGRGIFAFMEWGPVNEERLVVWNKTLRPALFQQIPRFAVRKSSAGRDQLLLNAYS